MAGKKRGKVRPRSSSGFFGQVSESDMGISVKGRELPYVEAKQSSLSIFEKCRIFSSSLETTTIIGLV